MKSPAPALLAREPTLTDQALFRATGAALIADNQVRLLRDAAENYPAWHTALAAARERIYFENYIIQDDAVGQDFAGQLAQKARDGVRVRLLYDWMGALGRTRPQFWKRLRAAGVEVRCFNPLSLDSPLGWLSRDHRKMIAVDGQVAFVTGLCVGQPWVGYPERDIPPWRDTGLELRGPAVRAVEDAFLQIWASAGPPAPEPPRRPPPPAGDMAVRVIASQPNTTGLYRLDQLIAAGARETLWLTDAYFLASSTYVQALRSAALDGVDVRLLVPGASDIALVSTLSRTIYRPLLEAGVRVYEWNGPMLHAKTAVADGAWTRIGSTNLNLSSWLSNWELDVAVEDGPFARAMETLYLEDLENATEIVLGARQRVRRVQPAPRRPRKRGEQKGSGGRAVAGALGIGSAVGAAITDRRSLGQAEARVMAWAGGGLLLFSLLSLVWPWLLAWPLAGFGVWVAVALLLKARRLQTTTEDLNQRADSTGRSKHPH